MRSRISGVNDPDSEFGGQKRAGEGNGKALTSGLYHAHPLTPILGLHN